MCRWPLILFGKEFCRFVYPPARGTSSTTCLPRCDIFRCTRDCWAPYVVCVAMPCWEWPVRYRNTCSSAATAFIHCRQLELRLHGVSDNSSPHRVNIIYDYFLHDSLLAMKTIYECSGDLAFLLLLLRTKKTISFLFFRTIYKNTEISLWDITNEGANSFFMCDAIPQSSIVGVRQLFSFQRVIFFEKMFVFSFTSLLELWWPYDWPISRHLSCRYLLNRL